MLLSYYLIGSIFVFLAAAVPLLPLPGIEWLPTQSTIHVVANDRVAFLPQTLTLHTIFAEFQPYLVVQQGCVPFPAIDIEGNVGQGLLPIGEVTKDCSHSTGQVYSRIGTHGGLIAVMYAWYFPKEQLPWTIFLSGHTNAWHNVILWFKDIYDTQILDVSVEKGGIYTASTQHVGEGSHPIIMKLYEETRYSSVRPEGILPPLLPLVEWDQLPELLKTNLNAYDWSLGSFHNQLSYSIKCPFNEHNFQANLQAAFNFR